MTKRRRSKQPPAAATPEQARRKRLLKHGLLAASSVLIVFLLGMKVEWPAVGRAMAAADSGFLMSAFLATLTFPFLNTVRWMSVLWALDVRIEPMRAFRFIMALWPVGTLTPGKAGELLKAAFVKPRLVGLGSVLAEHVVDVGVLGVFGIVFGAAQNNVKALAGGMFGLAAAAGVVVGARVASRILRGKPLGEKLEGFLAVGPRLWAHPRLLALCVGSSALNWFLSMLQLWFLLRAFGEEAPLGLVMAILPAATFAGLLPVSIAGAGTRDAAFLILAAGSVSEPAMLAASIVYTLLGYFLLGIAGLAFLGELTTAAAQQQARAR